MPNLSTKVYHTCDELLPELQKFMPGYEKTKTYFRKTDLYNYLKTNGDLQRAMLNSEKLCALSKSTPNDEHSYSEIYKVFKLLNELKPTQ